MALGLPGHTTLNLTPLASGRAVELLRERSALAEAGEDEEALLGKIAALADGIPLALELAATQIAMFGVAWTAERLASGRLEIEPETTGAATFRGSWALLPEREGRAVARLSLFSDRFALEAV